MHNFDIDMVEVAFAIALFINALLFVPQAWMIFTKKKSDEISLLTFGGFLCTQFLTALHAYIKHDYILLVGYILAMICCGSVVILTIKYRHFS